MHELGIAASILESRAEKEAAAPSRTPTSPRSGLRLGELAGVDRDALQFGFEVLVKDTEWEPLVLDRGIYSADAALFEVRVRVSHDRLRSAVSAVRRVGHQCISGEELDIAYMEVDE